MVIVMIKQRARVHKLKRPKSGRFPHYDQQADGTLCCYGFLLLKCGPPGLLKGGVNLARRPLAANLQPVASIPKPAALTTLRSTRYGTTGVPF